jgi:hypothetical protein
MNAANPFDGASDKLGMSDSTFSGGWMKLRARLKRAGPKLTKRNMIGRIDAGIRSARDQNAHQ